MEAINSREKQRARAIAEEYRSKGYEVIEEPTPEQLPEFLSGYHLDLLIKKDDEAKVIEVKSQSSLVKSPEIRDLARLLHKKPKWNFELVFVGENDQAGDPEYVSLLKSEDIQQGIEIAEKLLTSGFSESALMQAWSISTATVRLLTEADGISLDQFTPLYILKQAVTNGVITREDYNFFTRVMKHRNALAHGFKTSDLDPALVQELVSTTKRLIQQSITLELLIERIREGRVIFWAGAGFSYYAGLPDGKELTQKIKQQLTNEQLKYVSGLSSLPEVAEEFAQLRGSREELFQLIKKEIDKDYKGYACS